MKRSMKHVKIDRLALLYRVLADVLLQLPRDRVHGGVRGNFDALARAAAWYARRAFALTETEMFAQGTIWRKGRIEVGRSTRRSTDRS